MTQKAAEAFNAFELAFLGMVLGVACAMGLFTVGVSLNAFPFWFGVTISSALAWRRSWKTLATLWGIYLVGACLSFRIVSCSSTDAMRCYFSLQRLLADGWNPVYQLTESGICGFAKTTDFCYHHALFVPFFNSLAAAMASKALGFFNGDCFVGVVMILGLWVCAFRFGCRIFDSPRAGLLLAFGVAITPKITNVIAGHVDYTIYASMMMTVFFAGLWTKYKESRDLFLTCVSGATAIAAKATGLPFVLLILAWLILQNYRDVRFWSFLALGLALTFCLIVSPFIVNTIQRGSPFPTENLTADFTGNDDALRMGYMLRMIYAWVSPAVAKLLGSYIYHSDFNPVFDVIGGVAGYGMFFRIVLLLSVLCLLLSRKNIVLIVCVCLFVSANVLPLKYIGFKRYCPQLWAFPFLSALNFIYAPAVFSAKRKLFCVFRATFACLVMGLTCLFILRAIAYFEMSIAWQNAREQEFRQMREISNKWRMPHDNNHNQVKYAAICLLSHYGIEVVEDSQAPLAAFNSRYLLVSAAPIDEQHLRAFSKRFFICDSPKSFLRFDWVGAWMSPHFK